MRAVADNLDHKQVQAHLRHCSVCRAHAAAVEGSKGGRSTSPKKVQAARRNAKLGGRPRTNA